MHYMHSIGDAVDLEQLKQLDTFAQARTLSAAAKSLHMSQSALSRSMQRLESDLGHSLFDRSKNSVELNEAGKIALEHARAILLEERSLRDSLGRLSQQMRTLYVATVAPAPVWKLTSLVIERFPGTILQPVTKKQDEVVERLLNRTVDLAITTQPLQGPRCKSHEFMLECLRVLLPPTHPLASAEHAPLSAFDGERFLVDASAGFWIDLVRRHMPHAQLIEQSDRKVLAGMVQGTGLPSFTTNETEDWAKPQDYVNVPLEDDDCHVTFYLSVLDDSTDLAREIASFISEIGTKKAG